VAGQITNSPWDLEADFFAHELNPSLMQAFAVLPSSFDFAFVVKALQIILVDHVSVNSSTLIKALEFMYRDWDSFSEMQVAAVLCVSQAALNCAHVCQADRLRRILLRAFPTLFLYWDPQVARYYHHVLAYRALRLCGHPRERR
jgi:hypothetical protein